MQLGRGSEENSGETVKRKCLRYNVMIKKNVGHETYYIEYTLYILFLFTYII